MPTVPRNFARQPPEPPRWATAREAVAVILHPLHLRRSVTTAVVVGTILFALNQLDVVLADGWTLRVIVKGALTYLVPFCVANAGILSACKRRRSDEESSARGRGWR